MEDARRTEASNREACSTQGAAGGGASEFINGKAIEKSTNGPRGRKYATTVDSKEWTKVQGGDWELVKGKPPPRELDIEDKPLGLFLTIHDQVPGEPQHWSLLVAKENAPGSVYEVTGDTTHMIYMPTNDVDVFKSSSLRNVYELNRSLTPSQHQRLAQVAQTEPAPSAVNAAAIRENCQHWCVRVAQGLVPYRIVTQAKVDGLPSASLT